MTVDKSYLFFTKTNMIKGSPLLKLAKSNRFVNLPQNPLKKLSKKIWLKSPLKITPKHRIINSTKTLPKNCPKTSLKN